MIALARRIRCSARFYSQTGSAKLFADAAREEAEQSKRVPVHQAAEEPNWTGDERIQDTVLRMLVDKYKPMRTGTIQTAEQKLRKSPSNVQQYHPLDSPPLNSAPTTAAPSLPPKNSTPPPGGSWASVPLLPPGPPDHKPWHTEYKASDLEQSRKTEKEFNRNLGRLSRARESTLDYRLGLGNKRSGSRVNPVNMKGWTNLIEDKIEQARRAGMFVTVKGRGKPIVRTAEESNPFIGREDFLMNRIIKRNGAAPPWVQLQEELEAAVHTFRHLLLDGWTRHAVRALTVDGSGVNPKMFRDPAWARREASYHAAALAEVNECVRRYNALAPYPVRRPLYTLEAELVNVYTRGEENIAHAMQERALKAQREADRAFGSDKQVAVPDVDWAWIRMLGGLFSDMMQRLVRLLRR
ncbi:hypothetical protein FB45DRAFT_899997 [Roridomyces roridus]|uniref:DnaJ homologue subfamily C member 28 conserved domain-containing protein n=1 Tax=Roridomyces roridus TaxID=1738132 RepID=A0AAD7C7R7_9AGAR|nr:hypothetical protein FB45DRAFT_899997 [Roridomyces roridus]